MMMVGGSVAEEPNIEPSHGRRRLLVLGGGPSQQQQQPEPEDARRCVARSELRMLCFPSGQQIVILFSLLEAVHL